MGCCQISKVNDNEKDEPLLKEHLTSTVKTIESVEIKNDKPNKDSINDKQIENQNSTYENKEVESNEAVQNNKQSQVNEIKENEMDTAPDIVIEEKKENKMDDDNDSENDNAPDIDMDEFKQMAKAANKRKKKRNFKRDSKIDIKDLKKFENFTQKMDHKQLGIIVNLKIKSMDSKYPLFTVEIDQNVSILDLKHKIYEQAPDKIAILRQRLIHKGRLLKDNRTLKQYNILNANTIMLVRSRRNQKKHKNVTSLNKNKKDKKRVNSRNRAMTLNVDAPNHMFQRSITPQPQQM